MNQIQLNTATGNTTILVGEFLSNKLIDLKPSPILLVDEHVLCQHNDIFGAYPCISVPSGEQYKTLQTVEEIYRELVHMEADRSTLLVGVGGGLATDVAGFVAATYLREVPFGFISSTLLGQVDASIGGKNGVNLDGYKNMIGIVRQPSFVWCDLSLLKTLAHREYVSGIAEVIKYGAIWDRGFLQYLQEQMPGLLAQDPKILEHVVTTCATIKVEVVQKDEKESDLRRILNFGHTIGHALERNNKILHGEAIATGMVMAAKLSHTMGLLSVAEVDLVHDLVTAAGLPGHLELDPEELYQNIRKDKKKSGDQLHFVLLDGLGNAVVKAIPFKELKAIINDLC